MRITIDPNDKCRKVKPVLDMIQQRYQKFGILTTAINVHESMIPYCRKYGQQLKQRMPLKPIRSSYKVWCLNLEGRYLYKFIMNSATSLVCVPVWYLGL